MDATNDSATRIQNYITWGCPDRTENGYPDRSDSPPLSYQVKSVHLLAIKGKQRPSKYFEILFFALFFVFFVVLNEIVVEYKARDTHFAIYNSKPRVGSIYRKRVFWESLQFYRLSDVQISVTMSPWCHRLGSTIRSYIRGNSMIFLNFIGRQPVRVGCPPGGFLAITSRDIEWHL